MRESGWTRRALWLLLVTGVLSACATGEQAAPTSATAPMSPALYRRLSVVDSNGIPRQGRDAISIIVDDFVANLVADPRVSERFKSLPAPEVAKLKSNLADQLCQATGGPCSYLGRDMKTVHAGMKITEAEWNATVEDLVKALDKNKIGPKEKDELLAALGPMKKDIVGQ